MVITVLTSLLLLLFYTGFTHADNAAKPGVPALAKHEIINLGEKMYREGILPSGQTMQAFVQGDVPVDSTAFSCVSCHLRSGLGSLEGQVLTLPIDGRTLYSPMTLEWAERWIQSFWQWGNLDTFAPLTREWVRKHSAPSGPGGAAKGLVRSAYTDESLATALRGGVNPDGKTLDYVMPRYPLDDKDMEIMVTYLKNLSTGRSPGVTDNGVRFATIIAGDVKAADRETVVRTLKALATPWELKGPSQTWRSQLETYYKKDPVFAIVGGISNDDWQPIHEFCEQNRIPCILPITDLPVVSESDWYTLYFSRGLFQEGEAAAKYINSISDDAQGIHVIQVFRDDKRGMAIAKGFGDAWMSITGKAAENRIIKDNRPVTPEFISKLASSDRKAVILLWLGPKDLPSISGLANKQIHPDKIFLSYGLLDKDIYAVPEKIRKSVYITYPYRLPDDFKKYEPLLKSGMMLPGLRVEDANWTVRAKMSTLYANLPSAIFMMKGYFFRDRFLEVLDMMLPMRLGIDLGLASWDAHVPDSPLYPRVSFGPGQRYVSKGCYIVQLTDGPAPNVKSMSDWVLH
jgi:hypothetical protein